MPELPEVETVVRELRPQLVGRRIVRVRDGRLPLRRPWRTRWNALVAGRQVQSVERRGKWILMALDSGAYLVVHLGMTGQLTVAPSRHARQPHTHLVFDLDRQGDLDGQDLDRQGEQLRFRDVRRFGCAAVFDSAAKMDSFFADSGLGPEPFDLPLDYWRARLAKAKRSLKAILLDQRVVAGVGNIYADESLFEAKLHPGRLGIHMKSAEAKRLRQAIMVVLRRAIDKRGSSIRDYVGGTGQKGAYQDEFRVYGREDEACPRCRCAIQRMVLAGRSTHFCPRCQRPNGK